MDLNILFDMDQHFFLENCEEIVNQFKKPAHVNFKFQIILWINSLNENQSEDIKYILKQDNLK